MIDFKTVTIADSRLMDDLWFGDFGDACLGASYALGIFEILRHGPLPSEDIAKKLKLDPQMTEAMCATLVALGFLDLLEVEYALTDLAETYSLSDHPLHRAGAFQRRLEHPRSQKLIQVAKSGRHVQAPGQKTLLESWNALDLPVERAAKESQRMRDLNLAPTLAAVRSGAFSGAKHFLDLGGGDGMFAIIFATYYSSARVSVLELPAMCELGRKNIAEYGLTERIQFFASNFYDPPPWPADVDSIYLSNVLHDWPIAKCREILRNVGRALPADGSVFVLEALLDEGRTSPKTVVLFNLVMRTHFGSQQFTLSQITDLLSEVGLTQVSVVHRFGYYSLIKATRGKT